jgi:uroporphyrinogen decarboxylase
MSLSSRERVLTALNHQEPDRVPIDIGGTRVSSIMAVTYAKLREYLGMEPGRIRVDGPAQIVIEMEEDLRKLFGGDAIFIAHEPVEWRQGQLVDGTPAEIPAKFLPQKMEDGSEVLLDSEGRISSKRPAQGHWFDIVFPPLSEATSISDIEAHIETIETFDTPDYHDKSYEELAEKAKDLYENTDYLLVGQFAGRMFQASQFLRGWDLFLMDLVANPKIAQALMEALTEANIRRFEHWSRTVGPYVQVAVFEDDLGMQDRPLLSPDLYRKLVKPYHERLYGFAKAHFDGYLMLHTDGFVSPFIPDFIEMGIDILNPVQISAIGMETKDLKQEYGQDISFWGAGCESQEILPFGSPQEVRQDVKRRMEDLAPGGGFVFSSVHNIQTEVPPENIVALFEAAKEFGGY